ncbi:hypothetical protein GCM10010156_36400 [Planobispora rosea]|uniref:Uncharacterized protein n=1 Tax=Planobispora rosea TaxID=35762 RepID=A0A8J3RYB4_PLARO|nr:hypothetical protein [Planobispora rosea]GGS74178.1 hypothetical protein GCM10010156_36400 [Planobispora rosea]GIH81714.1 hypothetical protein Pro02_01220 [Planobispora rosea]
MTCLSLALRVHLNDLLIWARARGLIATAALRGQRTSTVARAWSACPANWCDRPACPSCWSRGWTA